jgi:hypothetical protein
VRHAFLGICGCALSMGCSLTVPLDDYDRGAAAGSGTVAGVGAGAGTGTGTGTGSTTGAGGAAACGELLHPAASSLVEDFADGDPLTGWDPPSGCVDHLDGHVVASPTRVGEFCQLRTAQAYHLTCSEIAFRVDEATVSSFGVQTFVYVEPLDGSTVMHVLKEQGFLIGASDSTDGIPVPGGYDALADRWWKLRHDGRELFFETAPDGETWTVRGAGPSLIPLDAVFLTLGAGIHASQDGGPIGTARFDCFNVPASSCP